MRLYPKLNIKSYKTITTITIITIISYNFKKTRGIKYSFLYNTFLYDMNEYT